MHPNIATSLDRADELLQDLLAEYEACLRSRAVSDRAVQLTHDVCERVRSVLDRVARRYWEVHISPAIAQDDRRIATVYFPVAKDIASMDSTLGRWRWKAVRDAHHPLYDYLLAQQPFSHASNNWLTVVNDLAVASKHIDLVPQTRSEERRTTVSGPGGSVSWNQGVTFGSGVSVMGAPVDPRTQRIVPTPGVVERVETWVAFIISTHNVNAAWLCREACAGTRRVATEMSDRFGLS